jgi:hypothetical protein
MQNSAALTIRSQKAHAHVTNNLRALMGVDGRSPDGKRYRDIVDSLLLEFGAYDPIRLRELAALRFSLEKVQAAIINGDVLRAEDQVRLANLITRREKELRAKARAAAVAEAPSLRGKLAGRYGGKPAASP